MGNLDTSKLEAMAQEICVDLIEDSCLGFCFEVHRAVKCGYFYQEFADTGGVKGFGVQSVQDKGASRFAPFLENLMMGPSWSCSVHLRIPVVTT